MWQVEAIFPFLMGVFHLQEEAEGQSISGTPFLKGQAAANPTAHTAKGSWLCLHLPPCIPICLTAHT